jgi:hypothetical protein
MGCSSVREDNNGGGVRRLALRLTAPAAGLAAMIALTLLYHLEPLYYYRVLGFIGIPPLRYPFLDFENVLSWVDCWQRGVDVYVNNPCDIFGRVLDYSPLWLRFTFLPGEEWTNTFGLCLAVSFFLALAVLPPPRSGGELLPRLAITLSPVTTFAVERANIDLLMFVIATAAGVFLLGPLRRRVAGYAMIVIAGLLKIYPLVLMVLTLRERPRVFLWINGATATVVLVTGLYFHTEIVKLIPNFERGAPFSRSFGAHYLPDIITKVVDAAVHPGLTVNFVVKLAMFAALFLAMAGWFFRLVRWREFCIALQRMPESDRMFLLIGAGLIGGSFFTGSSNAYRGIHLLFTLPGLLTMARIAGARKAAVEGCVLVVAVAWAGFFTWGGIVPQILSSWIGKVPSMAVERFLWLLSQIAWWQVSVLFMGVLIGCCSNWVESGPEWRRLLWGEVAKA